MAEPSAVVEASRLPTELARAVPPGDDSLPVEQVGRRAEGLGGLPARIPAWRRGGVTGVASAGHRVALILSRR